MKTIFSNPAALVKYLFIQLAAILEIFGIGAFLYVSQDPNNGIFYALYAFLMFIEAALILVCAFWIRKNERIFWMGVLLVGINIISVIFDQLGIINIAFAIYNGIIFFLLLINRKLFTAPVDSDD